MPYIPKSSRDILEEPLTNLIEAVAWSIPLIEDDAKAGTLNYLLCRLIMGMYPKELNRYRQWNEIVGVLESAKAEIQRRMIADYEDRKNQENGEVF
jgi:hypothetical protein